MNKIKPKKIVHPLNFFLKILKKKIGRGNCPFIPKKGK
jgi:hypothetical protein